MSLIDLSDDESHDYDFGTEKREVFLNIIKDKYTVIKLASALHGVKI